MYSSPSPRAVKTANIIAGYAGITTDERLYEMGFGSWEGMEIEKVEKLYPYEHNLYWTLAHEFNFPELGIETFQSIMDRTKDFLKEVAKGDGENILVVSHGITLRGILAAWEKRSLNSFGRASFLSKLLLLLLELTRS